METILPIQIGIKYNGATRHNNFRHFPILVHFRSFFIPVITPFEQAESVQVEKSSTVQARVQSSPQSIPEPATVVLFGTGLFGIVVLVWRKWRHRK